MMLGIYAFVRDAEMIRLLYMSVNNWIFEQSYGVCRDNLIYKYMAS